MFECKICKKEFKTRQALSGHQASHKKSHKINSEKSRNFHESKYYENPKYCLSCHKIILYSKRKNKFCDKSCAAVFNNKGRKRKGVDRYCLICNKIIPYRANKFCNQSCQHEYYYKKYIEDWKNGLEKRNKSCIVSSYIRRYLFKKYDNKCTKCGWNEINPFSNKIPLEIEHIDGNYTNNKEENLTLLCPNCHSLTKTYKALNKGNGRHHRMERYKNKKSY